MATNTNISMTRHAAASFHVRLSHLTWPQLYRMALLVSDGLMLLLAFAVAYIVRFYSSLPLFQEGVSSIGHYAQLIVILIPVWLALFAVLKLYDLNQLLSGTSEYARALNGCTSGMMLVVSLSFLVPDFVIARGWLLMAWALSTLLICSSRWLLRRGAQALRYKGWFVAPALIVGTNAEAQSLAMQLQESTYSGLHILGFIHEHDAVETARREQGVNGIPLLGGLDRLSELIRQTGAEEVIVATSALSRPQLLETTLQLSAMPTVKMALSSGLYEIFTTGLQVNSRNAVPLLSLNRLRLDPLEMFCKTALDYGVILLAAPVLAPILGIIALLIRLDSRGPIFYRRRVLGIGGKEFDAFKFRTMATNGDELLARHPDLLRELQEHHKLKDDPRVTSVGRWLRRLSLDELPQLINVLLGQMSLVGPTNDCAGRGRALRFNETESADGEARFDRSLASVWTL